MPELTLITIADMEENMLYAISFVYDDFIITDPRYDETLRFEVEPEYYGFTKELRDAIIIVNKAFRGEL